MRRIRHYFSLVKFSHTIFAMPFALLSYVYALLSTETSFSWWLLLKILLCMVFARNAAMGFNRWTDRRFDAANPRTANREIPSGKVAARSALIFVIINALGFLVTAALINTLTLVLAPIALFIILGYSYTKRFTSLSHMVLGVSLAIAPVGAYVAVAGSITVVPMLLSFVVFSWVTGFDILYSFQDADHDRASKLHSIPAHFSARTASWYSIILHLFTILSVFVLGKYVHFSTLYWIGSAFFIALLIAQQTLFRPTKTKNISAAFGLINGVSSVIFSTFAILDLLRIYGVL